MNTSWKTPAVIILLCVSNYLLLTGGIRYGKAHAATLDTNYWQFIRIHNNTSETVTNCDVLLPGETRVRWILKP